MNKNKYVWNWTVVAKLAPEYEKHLEEDGQFSLDEMRRIQIENVSDLLGVAPSFRTKGLDEAEMDIVRKMSGENTLIARESYNTAEMQQEKQEKPKPKLRLKPEYEFPKSPKGWYVPTTAALLPPKTVLDVGSGMWVGEDTFYSFSHTKSERGNKNPIIILRKHKYSHTPPFIRLMTAVYRFDPINNITSDIKKEFRGLTYNYKTGNAYLIRNIHGKKNTRYRRNLQGIFFNKHLARIALNTPVEAEQLKHRFMKKMEEEVRKYIPNLFIPSLSPTSFRPGIKNKRTIVIPKQHLEQIYKYEQEIMKFLLILLQGKIKKRFQPPNNEFINNLYSCFSEEYMRNSRNITERTFSITQIRKYKRNITRRILRALRKPDAKNLPNTILKIRFTPYKKLYSKLFNEPLETTSIIIYMIQLEKTEFTALKHIHHFLSYVINLPQQGPRKEALQMINNFLYQIINNTHIEEIAPIINAYIKTCKRFLNDEQVILPSWEQWEDMYSMGNRLGIRIRPNKFENVGDVNYLHDKFAEYFQRDNRINKDYNGFRFLEFKSPTKEYTDLEGNKFKFIQLRTASELVEEGRSMHHCVGSYAPQCAEGTSIIFSMTNGERSYVTVELKGNSLPYQKGSIYTIKDNIITNKNINDIIDKWHNDCLELHKNDTIPYSKLSGKFIEKFRLIKQLELQDEYRTREFGNRTEELTKRLNELITEIQEIKEGMMLATNAV